MSSKSNKNNKIKINNAVDRIKRDLNRSDNTVAYAIMSLYFIFLPLYFHDGYMQTSTYKYICFINLSVISASLLTVYLILRFMLLGRDFLPKNTVSNRACIGTDLAMLVFLLSAFISHLFSDYRTGVSSYGKWIEGSLRGTGGWFMGFLTCMIFVFLYFALSSILNFRTSSLLPAVGVSTLICIWGLLNRYGFSPIKMGDYDFRGGTNVASLGNMNWACGYTSVVTPLLIGLYYTTEKKPVKAFILTANGLSFWMILLNGSDSGVMALFVTLAVLLYYSLKNRDRILSCIELFLTLITCLTLITVIDCINPTLRTRAGTLGFELNPMLPLSLLTFLGIIYYILRQKAACPKAAMKLIRRIYLITAISVPAILILLIIINTLTDGAIPVIGSSPLFLFNDSWGSNRGATWRLGLRAFLNGNILHKLIGYGPDTFYFTLSADPELYNEMLIFGQGSRLTNAHNEWLTLLVNNGILGLASFIFIEFSAVKNAFLRAKAHPECIAFALSVISYAANNLFSFSQLTSTTFLFLIIGIEHSIRGLD